jgi:RNA recognition motif-containing protein
MATSLYVGNLNYSTTEDAVRDFFAQFGPVVRARIINDPLTGRSRGFAFVEMEDAAADAAIAGTMGKELDGRSLNVSKARPRGSGPPPGGPRAGGGPGFPRAGGGPPFPPRGAGGGGGGPDFGPPAPRRGERPKRREPRKEEKESFRAKMKREEAENNKDYLKYDPSDDDFEE